jgi:hypothetical protein
MWLVDFILDKQLYSNISTKFLPLPSVQSNHVIFFRITWLYHMASHVICPCEGQIQDLGEEGVLHVTLFTANF